MAIQMDPVLGHWYRDGRGRFLQVTGLSGRQGLVEVRYHDGRAEELPLEEWDDLSLQAVGDLPEGLNGGLDDEELRRATGWGERSPDDFPNRG